jgi:neutral ceramidase
MVNAAHQAKDKLQPARMAFGTGTAYLNVNRDAIHPQTHRWTQASNLVAPSDKTVAVLKFETISGEPIGVYVNYAMHPINGYLSNFTSADFAGAMSRYVEQAYEDKPKVIFPKARPEIRINYTCALRQMAWPHARGCRSLETCLCASPSRRRCAMVPSKSLRWIESQGTVRALDGERGRPSRRRGDPGHADATRTEHNVRIWGSQTEITCPGRTRTDKGREGTAGTYVDGPPVPIRIGVLGVGDVAPTSADAEVYNLIAQRMKRQSPMTNTVMVTLANGRAPSGYIPDDASFSHNCFQVLGSRLEVGCGGFHCRWPDEISH